MHTKNSSLISVLIPAYNHERYVQDTINSIINQTYKNIELIIIDDGSSDSTWEKIQEMKPLCEKHFSRVVFKKQKNHGTCYTFNKLISLSKGEYIYIIASDDIAKPEALEIEYDFLSNNPDYSLCVGNNQIIDGNGNICYWDKYRNNVYTEEEAIYKTFKEFLEIKCPYYNNDLFGTYKTLYSANYITNGYLIRKEIFSKTGLYTKKAPLEDYYIMLQISKYSKMKYIDQILFSYRWHSTNTIKNPKIIKMHEKLMNYENNVILPKTYKKAKFEDVKEVYETISKNKTPWTHKIFHIYNESSGKTKHKIIVFLGIKLKIKLRKKII